VIRAIFLDVDGTLLTTDKRISAGTLDALVKCKANGIKLFLATARPPTLDRALGLSPLELSCFDAGGVFNNGGTLIYSGQKMYHPMAKDTVSNVLKTAYAWPDVNVALQLEEERHAYRFFLEDYSSWGVAPTEALAIDSVDLSTVVKMLVFSRVLDMDMVTREVTAAHRSEASIYLTGKPGSQFLEVVGRGVSKMHGVRELHRLACLSEDEVAVFGDDRNDVEMLSAFPNSVAMGNASDEVKRLARYVTLPNDEDGIVYALTNQLMVL
jgi:Cof subfamily protein (haloacid dehalogenase superfamily)